MFSEIPKTLFLTPMLKDLRNSKLLAMQSIFPFLIFKRRFYWEKVFEKRVASWISIFWLKFWKKKNLRNNFKWNLKQKKAFFRFFSGASKHLSQFQSKAKTLQLKLWIKWFFFLKKPCSLSSETKIFPHLLARHTTKLFLEEENWKKLPIHNWRNSHNFVIKFTISNIFII